MLAFTSGTSLGLSAHQHKLFLTCSLKALQVWHGHIRVGNTAWHSDDYSTAVQALFDKTQDPALTSCDLMAVGTCQCNAWVRASARA